MNCGGIVVHWYGSEFGAHCPARTCVTGQRDKIARAFPGTVAANGEPERRTVQRFDVDGGPQDLVAVGVDHRGRPHAQVQLFGLLLRRRRATETELLPRANASVSHNVGAETRISGVT